MTFEEWWDRPEGCGSTPNTYKGWESSCREAWEAGQLEMQQQLADEQAYSAKLREWIAEAPHRVWCMRLDPYDERDHGCTCGKEALTLPHADINKDNK